MNAIFSTLIVLGVGYIFAKNLIKLLPKLWFIILFILAFLVFLIFRSFLEISGLDIVIMVIACFAGAWAYAKRRA